MSIVSYAFPLAGGRFCIDLLAATFRFGLVSPNRLARSILSQVPPYPRGLSRLTRLLVADPTHKGGRPTKGEVLDQQRGEGLILVDRQFEHVCAILVRISTRISDTRTAHIAAYLED